MPSFLKGLEFILNVFIWGLFGMKAEELLSVINEVRLNRVTTDSSYLASEIEEILGRAVGFMTGTTSSDAQLPQTEVAEHIRWCGEYPATCKFVGGRDNMIKFVDELSMVIEDGGGGSAVNAFLQKKSLPLVPRDSVTFHGLNT